MTPEPSARASPRPIGPRRTSAAARAARPRSAPEEVDRGSGPPAGSSADAGKPGRLTAPVRAGHDRVDRAAGELAPSAAGRAGVRETVRAGAAPAPSDPVLPADGTAAGRSAAGPSCGPAGPGNSGSPPVTTGGTNPATGAVTGASAEPTGASAEPTGASAEPTGASAEPTGASAEPTGARTGAATGATAPATGAVSLATGAATWATGAVSPATRST